MNRDTIFHEFWRVVIKRPLFSTQLISFTVATYSVRSRCSITRTGYSMPSRSAFSFDTTTILLPLTLIAGRACPQHPDEFFEVTSISVLLFHYRSALAAFLRLRYCHGILSGLHGCRFVPMSDEVQERRDR